MSDEDATTRLVAGCMTGTSIDGLDAALVEITGVGLAMRARLVRSVSVSLGSLGALLRSLAEQTPMSAGAIAGLSRDFSLLHVDALRKLLGGPMEGSLSLVCIHGQTVFHQPPVSWQLLTPGVVADALGVDVVSDLRAADLARGGQGAPITPLADWVLFRAAGERRTVINLGGFCNLTTIEPGEKAGSDTVWAGASPFAVGGRDLCACNHLLDTIARRVLGMAFDKDGAAALAGSVDDEALDDLTGVLLSQSAGKRSLGTGDEAMGWVGRHRGRLSGEDLCATACEGIGQMIARGVETDRIVLAGGGVKNRGLVGAIASCVSCKVETSDIHGVPAEMREAVCMAVLGALCQDDVPITLGGVTGADGSASATPSRPTRPPPLSGTFSKGQPHGDATGSKWTARAAQP